MSSGPQALVQKGRDALTRGDFAAAAAAADERLRAEPRDLDALHVRYLALQRGGDAARAIDTLRTMIGIEPRLEWAYNDLVQLLYRLARRDEAEQTARTLLRINPTNAQAHNLFATLLSETGDLPPGEWHFRRAIELGGAQQRFVANLALNLMRQGRVAEAERYFAQADSLGAADLHTLGHWSKLHEVQGDLDRALQLLDRAEAASSPAEVSLLRASYLARAGRSTEALAILDSAGNLGGDALLERGRLLDRLGRHDEAWRNFAEGKRKLAAQGGGLEYQADQVDALFARLKRFFRKPVLGLLPRAQARRDVAQPVFIIGFPRSGTTLVEQVLASHSAVRAGGELAFITELRRLATQLFPASEPYPENLARTWTADNFHVATLFRDYYLARAESYGLLGHGKTRFTDKMPFNEMWLPVIRMAFPEAKIIRIVRHPLDVCVSMMAHHLTHGFHCAYRIESIVHHLAAVHDLVEHYAREMGAHELVLKYEVFVHEQEAQTRRLLDYVGLPFEAACLAFHENRRYAPTPSYAQVTEKLNDRSIGRHVHYARHLQPFLPQLAPLLEAHGYVRA